MSKDVTPLDIAAIVERIKEAYGFKRNADVARHLGLEPRSDPIGKAIRRNSLDLARIVERCSDLNQDWLLYGRGQMRAGQTVYPSEVGNMGEIVGESLGQLVRLPDGSIQFIESEKGEDANDVDSEKEAQQDESK